MENFQEGGQVAQTTAHDKDGLDELEEAVELVMRENLMYVDHKHKYEEGAFPQTYKGKISLQREPQIEPRGPRAPVRINLPRLELGKYPTKSGLTA